MQPANRHPLVAAFRKLTAWLMLAGVVLHAFWINQTEAAKDKHVHTFTAVKTFTVDTRPLHLAIHKIGNGAVIGAGAYPKNATIDVHATPDPDNFFTGWTGDLQANANPFSFILDKTVTLIAHFSTQDTLPITTPIKTEDSTEQDERTDTGTPNGDSTDSTTLSSAPLYVNSFTAASMFTVDTRPLYLTIHAIGSGSALGAGIYPKNATVEVKATPEADNLFTGWTGDLNATANHLVLTLDKSLTLFANFNPLDQDQVSPFASTDLGSGWGLSPWLGTIYFTDANWIYHATLGWIYVPELNDNDFWIWDEQLNWLWTNRQVYPFLYGNDINNWLYYDDSATAPRLFYNYADDSWITISE